MLPAFTPSRIHSNHLAHSRIAYWRLLTVADDSSAHDATAAPTGNDATNASPQDNASSDSSATASSFVDVVDVEAVKRAATATVSC
jgi:hypothetical protein